LLGIVAALRNGEHSARYDTPICGKTDYKNLTGFLTTKELNRDSKMGRELAETFEIEHMKERQCTSRCIKPQSRVAR